MQFGLKAILILLAVLVLQAPSAVSALGAISGYTSGMATLEPLSLEDDSAVLASSPDNETAPIATTADSDDQTSDSSTVFASAPFAAATAESDFPVRIRAVNPGYNTDMGKNAGELIELINFSDREISLDNVAIIYTTKPTTASPNGKSTILHLFSAGSRFIGHSILLRFFESPEASDENQDLLYDTSLAMTGSLSLVKTPADFDLASMDQTQPVTTFGEITSSVCWNGGDSCLPNFSTTVKSRSYTTILLDNATGAYVHTNDYTPLYDSANTGLYLPPVVDSSDTTSSVDSPGGSSSSSFGSSSSTKTTSGDFDPDAPPACPGLRFSEILTYYADDAAEQFIEFYNSASSSAQLSGCKLRYKKKLYPLTAGPYSLPGSSYFVYRPTIKLTKNPTAENLYELLDVNGTVVDLLNLPHGQKSGTSYALLGANADGSPNWQITYAPTPGEPNLYQEFRTCPAGKIINEATGNCVNASKLSSATKDCGPGKYRNPATGRCKSYSSSSSGQTPCKEGYERNPETNRCRKIRDNNGTDYPVVPLSGTEENTSFIALWALAAVAGLGAIYVLFQFRKEIAYFFRKLLTKIKK